MPLSSLSHTLKRTPAPAARNSSICSGVCTTSSNRALAAASSCSRSNTPSSSTVGAFDARLAQREPFIDARHREGIGALERARHGNEPVAVGIGLDHGHDRERGAQRRITLQIVMSAAESIAALTIGVMSPEYALGVGFRSVILELGVLAEEGQLHIAGGAVALLRDDDVGDALARGVRVVLTSSR
jgi:hypothetical protein